MHKVVVNSCYGGFGLSEAAEERFKELAGKEYQPFGPHSVPRHNPILIQVVEELGEEAASGDYSELTVSEITGTQYWIEEYDGCEILRTPENMRWITIEGGE
tara:strand:- start:961 stop:1266 length:306 start_codon:yes stop_codon:yes gene_type:complete